MDVSDIFYFFLFGEGEGGSEAPSGGGSVFYFKSQEGGGFPGRGGAEGPGGCLRQIGAFFGGGGGLNIFFRGRNVHQEKKNLSFFFGESTFQKCGSSEDWTRIARISIRIGEKTRFARIWPSASKTVFLLLRIDSRESAKR